MKKLSTLTLGAAMLMLNACSNDTLTEEQNPTPAGDADQVTFIAGSFVRGGADSRTAIVLPGSTSEGSGFAWTAGDTIGIAPSSGAQAYFVIADGTDSDKATFNGGAWAMKTGESSNYAAYYPFIGDIYLDRTKIPVNYIGQKYSPATGNKLTSLAPFDYMAAKPSTATSSSSVSFEFSHLSSLVEVKFALPNAGTVNSFYFSAAEKVLPVKGSFDLTASNVAITSTDDDKAYTIPVTVEGLTTTADNQTVSVFFLMPPADLSSATLGFTVNYSYTDATTGKTVTENLPFSIATGKNMAAQMWYTYVATAYENQPYAIAVNVAYEFSGAINDALGELGGTKLRFMTNSAVTSSVEIYSDENTVKAYAVRNGDWLEVHTIAREFKLSESCSNMFSSYDYSNFMSLEELDLSALDTSSVTDMSSMFYGCSSLTTLDLSKFNTQKVEHMNCMFYGCSSLTTLDLSNFNTSSVTAMDYMFYGCSSLTSLVLSKFDTSSVTGMSYMFHGCFSLTTLDLSKFDTQKVVYMNSMFDGCSSLTTLDLSKFDTSSVTGMDYMFFSCSSLITLDLSSFTFADGVTCTGMFYGVGTTEKMTTIYVSSNDVITTLNDKNTNIDSSTATLTVKTSSGDSES